MPETPEKPDVCSSCSFPTPDLELFGEGPMQTSCWLCHLCANTYAGNRQIYPNLPYQDGQVLATICRVGNEILAEIRRAKRA